MAPTGHQADISDPRVLRAIAHPVRNRILNELSAAGPCRAADISRMLGIPANQASFHLRQLAKYGLVEPAPEAARDGRDRVWRTVKDGTFVNLSAIEEAPGGKAAAAVWRRNATAWAHHVVDCAYHAPRVQGTFFAIGESSIRLTGEEARDFSDELDAVIERWEAKTRGTDDSRRTYHFFTVLQPHPDPVDRS